MPRCPPIMFAYTFYSIDGIGLDMQIYVYVNIYIHKHTFFYTQYIHLIQSTPKSVPSTPRSVRLEFGFGFPLLSLGPSHVISTCFGQIHITLCLNISIVISNRLCGSNKAKNHPPVITIFIGGMFLSHGWLMALFLPTLHSKNVLKT